MARSLAKGQGLSLINYPNSPSNTNEIRYPPGYPIILAPLVLLFPNQLGPLKAASTVFTLLSIGLGYLLLIDKGCKRGSALALILLFATNGVVVSLSTQVMSEAAHFLALLFALILYRKFMLGRDWLAVPTGVASAFCFLIHATSVALLAAMGLHLIFNRKYLKLLLWSLCVALSIMPYLAYNVHVWGTPINPNYLRLISYRYGSSDKRSSEQLSESSRSRSESANSGVALRVRCIQQIKTVKYFFSNVFPSILLPGIVSPKARSFYQKYHVPWLTEVEAFILLTLMILGWSHFARHGHFKIVEIFTLLYLMILVLWPWILPRYLYPVLLFLYLYLFFGAKIVLAWLENLLTYRWQVGAVIKKARGLGVAVILAVVMALSFHQVLRMINNPSKNYTPDLEAGSVWLDEHTTKSAVVMTPNPVNRYLYVNRHTIRMSCDRKQAEELLLDSNPPVNYVLIAPWLIWSDQLVEGWCSVNIVEPLISLHRDRFELVYEDNKNLVRVYHVRSQNAEVVSPTQSIVYPVR